MSSAKAVKQSKSNHESASQMKNLVQHSSSATDTQSKTKSNMEAKDGKRKKRRSVSRNLEKREYDFRPRVKIDYCDAKRRVRSKSSEKPQKGRKSQRANSSSK